MVYRKTVEHKINLSQSHQGIKHTEATKEKISEIQKNLLENGRGTRKNKHYGDIPKFRKMIFEHFENKCSRCGGTNRLCIHHKTYENYDNNVDNYLLLCTSCHTKLHNKLKSETGKFVGSTTIMHGVSQILEGLHVDRNDENFKNTPARVARSYAELFEGLNIKNEDIETLLKTRYKTDNDEMITFRNFKCFSMCPHHLLPVIYTVHFGYIPNKYALGLDKIPMLIEMICKKPTLQENVTTEIIKKFQKFVEPKGAIIVLIGDHLCMQMRNTKQKDAQTITSEVTGIFKTDASAKAEFFEKLKLNG